MGKYFRLGMRRGIKRAWTLVIVEQDVRLVVVAKGGKIDKRRELVVYQGITKKKKPESLKP